MCGRYEGLSYEGSASQTHRAHQKFLTERPARTSPVSDDVAASVKHSPPKRLRNASLSIGRQNDLKSNIQVTSRSTVSFLASRAT